MLETEESNIVLDEIVCEIPEKYIQWRLTVNIFREKEYLHLRKYFLDFEGEYVPSREGACIEVNIQRLANIVSALFKVLSEAEAVKEVVEYLDEETIHKLSERLKSKSR